MSTSRSDRSVADANRTYFKVLAISRGSLSMLPALAGPIVFLLGITNFGPLNTLTTFKGYPAISFVFITNVFIMGICVVALLLSAFKGLIYRFQPFFSALMASLAVALVYSLCLLALPLAIYVEALGKQFYVELFTVGGLITAAVLAGTTTVHVWLLRRRLRVGHSEKRTFGNYTAVSGSNRSKMFWIVFGVVAVVPNLLTGGQYLGNFLFAIMLLFFACVTPSLPVEFAYLAYLKSKDRDYWEDRPSPIPRRERLLMARKVAIWALSIAAGLWLFWALAKYVL